VDFVKPQAVLDFLSADDAPIRLPGVTFKSDAPPTTKSSQSHGVLYEHISLLLPMRSENEA
jgi:hypothetical protein